MRNLSFDVTEAANLLSALSNPRRFQILVFVSEGEREVNAIADWLGLSQSAVSQHLRRLREVKAVQTRREAQQILYSLGSAGAEIIIRSVMQLSVSPRGAPA
ncbi:MULTISPECIES: ArsR/SmtB family transcription factor [Rhizobium]|uniref:DNA-binding transcriptional ArsR family regulator n=1 Tax=Rhizobium wenxiniae TaxID=1737357 RepID=A0A7W9YE27_9HYPH|nr:metalloregulator ArsR/SmtB family transcription factor [Rhizobium wenxiniae]MBB6166223.1 DNA-binding transcriptional ArsR family regulator [Rhizobium wenxiniae]GGG22349.1 transcriptional regulator [Rhizobium wenxiniae]